MSDEINTQKSNKHKKRHRKKHYTVLPYISTPAIFVLVSMIVVVPVLIFGMNTAVKTVHKAQEVLVQDYNDVEAITDYTPSGITDGTVNIPRLYTSQKLGVITCDDAGLKADAYYGTNRVSLRNGVGVEAGNMLCGQGGRVNVYGNNSTYFKALENVSVGDMIKFETLWGTYTYTVKTVTVASKYKNDSSNEVLCLVSAKDKSAFASYDSEKLIVVADYVSGPSAEEVLYE